ncbi:MAG: hypothetical protein OXH79_02450 [Boseongicola sp.]|nr:hypothetical protein [Boseongicola sp.]
MPARGNLLPDLPEMAAHLNDVPGRLILGMAPPAMMDDGIKVIRVELHAAAALAGFELRNQRVASGGIWRFFRIVGTFRSTLQGARPGLYRTYKMTSSSVLG